MALHFKVRGGWPTPSDPFVDFARPELSSHLAQRYNSISIEVHPDHPAPASDVKLITASEASANRHHSLTPKTSLVPVESLATKLLNTPQLPLSQPPLKSTSQISSLMEAKSLVSSLSASTPPSRSQSTAPHGPCANLIAPSTPSGANLFGTSVYSPPDPRISAQRKLPPSAVLQAPSLLALPLAPKWPDILQWNISSTATRSACAPEYLGTIAFVVSLQNTRNSF
jgi:hypothetical protein